MSDEKFEETDKNYEKITVNLPVVDVGKIDYLVDNGYYNSRAEFVRISVKNEINKNAYEFENVARTMHSEKDKSVFVGIGSISVSREYLEKCFQEGKKVKIFVIGHIRFGRNVDVDLVEKTVKSFKAYGIKRGPPGVIDYLSNLKYINGD